MPTSNKEELAANEQQRLIISIAIIATTIGAYGLTVIDGVAWSVIRGAITVQGILAFLFLLSSASNLKYKGSGSLFHFSISTKIHEWFYDTSIEMFWATAFSGFMLLILGNAGANQLFYWLLGASLVCTAIAVSISIKIVDRGKK